MGRIVDEYLMKKAKEKGIKIPEKPSKKDIEKRTQAYSGGFVSQPKAGLHESVAVFDFDSIYPSIIVTYNISPEISFWKSQNDKGFIPEVIEELIEKRKKAKGKKKTELKLMANAMYGVIGQKRSRWYSHECAEKITELGRKHVKDLAKEAEKIGEVIYSDTDSVFCITSRKKAEEFVDKFNKSLPGIMKIKLEDVYDKGLFVSHKNGGAKKRYALLKGNKMVIKGFEAVRKDWCDAAREMQKKVLLHILKGKQNEALKTTRMTIEKVKKGKISKNKLILRTMLSRKLSQYKVKAAHVKVAKEMKDMGYGDTVEYIITEGKGTITEKAKSVGKARNYDADYYINNQLIPAALRVLGEFGYTKKDLTN